jgi:hypothetical protein
VGAPDTSISQAPPWIALPPRIEYPDSSRESLARLGAHRPGEGARRDRRDRVDAQGGHAGRCALAARLTTLKPRALAQLAQADRHGTYMRPFLEGGLPWLYLLPRAAPATAAPSA